MVGSLVRFSFTCCEESQTNERVFERVSLRFFTTREQKSYALTNHEVIYMFYSTRQLEDWFYAINK